MMGLCFIAFSFLLIFIFFSVNTLKSFKSGGALNEALKSKEGAIGVVEVTGVLMNSRDVIKNLSRAESDSSIKAIILRINSPGGAVAPAQEIYQEIRRIDKKKPVYASFSTLAASGGYYIGSAARKIFANPGTMTGSIGVIMKFVNLERLYDFLKMDPETIKAGRYKDLGSPDRQMTEEERGIMQEMIDEVHRRFISDILEVRKDRIKGDLADHARGQIFSGQRAFELGLVDELNGLHEAARKIHKELKLPGNFGLRYFKKKEPFLLKDILSGLKSELGSYFLQEFPVLMSLWFRGEVSSQQ